MRALHYWEHTFFAGLFGIIALYPFVAPDLAFVVHDDGLFTLLVLAGIATLVTLIMYGEFYEHGGRRWAVLAAFSLAVLLVPLVAIITTAVSPVVALWFVDAVLALSTFGYSITKHLFRRVEHDFNRCWQYSIAFGLAANFFAFLFVSLTALFPVPLIALSAGAVLYASSYVRRAAS